MNRHARSAKSIAPDPNARHGRAEAAIGTAKAHLRLEIDAESMSDEEREGGRGRAASCALIARKGRA